MDRLKSSGERPRRSAARWRERRARHLSRGPGRRCGMDRARRSKRAVENRSLAKIVSDKLRLLWSPEQIAGWLKHTYPSDQSLHVHTRPSTAACAGKPPPPPLSQGHAEDGGRRVIKNARKLPKELYKSLTWIEARSWPATSDSRWPRTSRSTSRSAAAPQRGSNENTNGLLRQYMPKGHRHLRATHRAKLNAVARQLNERPKGRRLGYETPAQKFDETVALTS